eukprot:4740811-Pleurochrysis_carterae.AAC.2
MQVQAEGNGVCRARLLGRPLRRYREVEAVSVQQVGEPVSLVPRLERDDVCARVGAPLQRVPERRGDAIRDEKSAQFPEGFRLS